MKVWTWNVNSVRSKMDKVNSLLVKYDLDILFLTETKITKTYEVGLDKLIHPEYRVIWNSNKLSYYHGVALIYKKTMNVKLLSDKLDRREPHIDMKLCYKKNCNAMQDGLNDVSELTNNVEKAHSQEGRIITVLIRYKDQDIVIVGTYVPNSGVDRVKPLKRLAYRTLIWDKDIYLYLEALNKKYDRVIWLGDLNVARLDHDISSARANYAGTTPEERSNFNSFIEKGWVDTWELLHSNKLSYHDRWTYGYGKGTKLRLDYVICSLQMRNCVQESVVDQKFDGSDHVPMGTTFDI